MVQSISEGLFVKEIAYRDWARFEHSEFMARSALPFFQAEYLMDVTRFKQYTKSRGTSFYFGLIWATTKVMEAREDFRWRLRGESVVLVDSPEPSFTDLSPGSELFKVVHAGYAGEDMAEYAARARALSAAQTSYFPSDEEEMRDDYTYFSSITGATLTSLVQSVDTNKADFIPRVAWSRYQEQGGRLMMPYTIACNHRLVDGLHVARLFTEVEAYINALD